MPARFVYYPSVFRRSWVMLSVAMALLISGGALSEARADLKAEEETSEGEGTVNVPDELTWLLFATSYYMFNAHRVSGPYNSLEYPYADSHGFGLVFAGGDVSYRTDKWGVRIDLRWGQNVDRLTELAPLSRGFVTWIPHKMITLDLGYFAAFIGVENADEWRNPTFTRGVIYFKMQPFRHLGLRALIQPHDKVDITVIAANGSIFGTSFPSDVRRTVQVPAVGAQLIYRFAADADVRLGGVASPNGSNGNRDWQAIFDLIATWSPKAWDLFIDGDYQFSRRGPLTGINATRQWGVSVGGSYEFEGDWAVGFRGEYFGAEEDIGISADFTVTGTIRYSPVQYLILSFEPRAEFAGADIFFSRPFVTDPATGDTMPSLNQNWFFGFWIGATARIGN